jgi:hypothetical protein
MVLMTFLLESAPNWQKKLNQQINPTGHIKKVVIQFLNSHQFHKQQF